MAFFSAYVLQASCLMHIYFCCFCFGISGCFSPDFTWLISGFHALYTTHFLHIITELGKLSELLIFQISAEVLILSEYLLLVCDKSLRSWEL